MGRIDGVEALGFTFEHGREPLSYCLVRVAVDDGTVGWGEACDSFGCTYASVVEAAVADALAPLLVGEELDRSDRLVHKMRSWTRRRLGHQWVAAQAISGVEMALWDALGKVRGRPAAELLGGPPEPAPVPVYASSVFLEEGSADWHLGLLEPLLSAGVRAVKLRIGVDWEADLETLAAVRDGLGPGVAVMIDGNENYTVSTALAIAERLAALGVEWFEEPVPQEDHRAMEEVAARSPVPIAYGEHMFRLAEFAEAIRRRWAGVLQPDAATCEGCPRPCASPPRRARPGSGWCPIPPRARWRWLPTCTWQRQRPRSGWSSTRIRWPSAGPRWHPAVCSAPTGWPAVP